MKFARSSAVILFLWLASLPVYSQAKHVRSHYVEAIQLTVVDADSLYVINMPDQFMEMKLIGHYPGQVPPNTGASISVRFYSYSPTRLHDGDDGHRLSVKADDGVLDFGLLDYSAAVATANNSLPADALVRKTNKGKNVVEMMRLDGLRPSDIEELAKARDVTMKIGPRVFRLTPTQMSILSEFAASFTPSGETIRAEKPLTKTDPVIPPDVPSESNKASLEQTLKWLKQELSRDSSVKDGLTPRRIEASDFGGCRIRYRFIPLSRNSPISNNLVNAIMEYELNLADLRPDLITTVNLEDYSRVYFTTRNNEPKIKAISRANDNGFAGRTVDEKAGSTAFFNLSNANAAAQVKVALAHAINLCQAGALARPLGRAHLFGEKSSTLLNSRPNAPFDSAGRSK